MCSVQYDSRARSTNTHGLHMLIPETEDYPSSPSNNVSNDYKKRDRMWTHSRGKLLRSGGIGFARIRRPPRPAKLIVVLEACKEVSSILTLANDVRDFRVRVAPFSSIEQAARRSTIKVRGQESQTSTFLFYSSHQIYIEFIVPNSVCD